MNIEFENNRGIIYDIEIIITSHSQEEDTNSHTTEFSVDYIPKGSTQKEIEQFAKANHWHELIEEYQDTIDWRNQGMEFYHYN